MRDETKVGLFVLVGLITFATAIFLLGDFSFQQHYVINAEFHDVSGLADKSNIKLSVVEVGKVKEIAIDGDKVVVRLSVARGVKIYKNSKFLIGSTSLIGSKFLQIDQGTPESGVVADGETVYGENALSMDRAITSAIANLENFMNGLNNKGEFTRNLNDVVENLRDISANLNELIAVSQPSMEKGFSRMDDVMTKLDELLAKTNSIVSKIDSGEGAIGTLVSDKETKEDVKATIANIKDTSEELKTMMGKVSKIKTYWLWDTRYDPAAGYNMNSVGVKLYMKENKYYYAGISNFFNMKNADRGVSYEIKNTVDAWMGWDWKAADFYVGAIRGNAGFGLRYRPFYGDALWGRLSLLAEGNEFARNRAIQGRDFNRPRYDAGMDFRINRNIETGVRLTDMLEVKRINYTAKILFEDKDLAYLFGFIGGGSAASFATK